MDELQILLFTVAGVGTAGIVYWLIEKAHQAGVLESKKARFFSAGSIWFLLVILFALADDFARPAWVYVLTWLGGWVQTILFKSGVKDNERKEPPSPAA